MRALVAENDVDGFRFLGRAALDVTSSDRITAVAANCPPTAIINLAAYTNVNRAESEPKRAFLVNGQAPGLLAALANTFDAPLIHISTDYVFDGTKSDPYLPEDPMNPLCVYGASKRDGEDIVRTEIDQHVIIRTSWVFSEYRPNFVATMAQLATKNDNVRVVDDQVGGPTYAGDLASAILGCLQHIRQRQFPWGTYHFAGQPFISWANFAARIFEAISEHTGGGAVPEVERILTDAYPQPAARPLNSRLDSSSLNRILDLDSSNWEYGLKHTLNELLQLT